jgi:hypothetical protein
MSRRRILRPAGAAAVLLYLMTAPARAGLTFPEPSADAGEVRGGMPLVHHFAFVNDGPGAVEITDVQASCGCVKPRLEKQTYAPGEKGDLLLDVHTLGQGAGDHVWRLKVSYREGGEPRTADLQLRGRVITELTVQPAALTVFTSSGVGHQVTLTDLRAQPLHVASVRTTSPHLEARVGPAGQDGAGHRTFTIGLAVTPGCPEGRHDEALHIFTDDPAYRELTVPVTVVKRPKQHVSPGPAAVSLFAPHGQPAPSRIVLLRPEGDEAVAVEGVEADDAAVVCTWAAGPNNLATLKVTVDRARVNGDSLRSAIHVRLVKPVPETLTIPVTCRLE